jgi:hypothetical protein
MTSQPRTTFTREPYTVYLYQLLDEMRRGELLLPRFQRPLVWEPGERLDLMNSILRGLPIGAVMLWDTSRTDIPAWERVGPYKIVTQQRTPRKYVLDGTQRLTSLLAALSGGEELSEAQQVEWWFGLNLQKEHFERWRPSTDYEDGKQLFPSSSLLSHDALVEWRLRYPKIAPHLFASAKEAVKSFFEYKIAVIPVATNDLTAAAEVLYTVNSRGTQMSTLHMMHAKLTGQGLDLLQRVQYARERLLSERRWADLPDDDIVRVAQLRIGLDVSEQNIERLTSRLYESISKTPTLLDDAAIGLCRAARLLRENCGVASPELLPYGVQAVLLGAALVDREPTQDETMRLVDWLWLTTYWGTLFGRPQVRTIYNYLLSLLGTREEPWPQRKQAVYDPLPPALKGFSARVKALGLQLALLKPRAANGVPFDGAIRLAESKVEALGRLILRWSDGKDDDVMLEDAGVVEPHQRPSLSSAGNRFLVPPEGLDLLRELLFTQPMECPPEIRRSHHITDEALKLLDTGDLAGFVRQRGQDLTALEKAICEKSEKRLLHIDDDNVRDLEEGAT